MKKQKFFSSEIWFSENLVLEIIRREVEKKMSCNIMFVKTNYFKSTLKRVAEKNSEAFTSEEGISMTSGNKPKEIWITADGLLFSTNNNLFYFNAECRLYKLHEFDDLCPHFLKLTISGIYLTNYDCTSEMVYGAGTICGIERPRDSENPCPSMSRLKEKGIISRSTKI